ncbi:MAG: hypothetical protein CVT65_03580 [Actinobacteria bacterium HGW-Actinobacteria-5]|jgi:hypothetical protein|nr:MAG: hypothetical protein CVT65_03580 [Actinobacteria bacterium HGW-Actinobacteria-5]
MKAWKGFTPQPDGTLKCLEKVYREGETYIEPRAELCSTGMHACTDPLDVLTYYPPTTSAYHEVEVDEDAVHGGGDSKVSSKRLAVGVKVGVVGLVKAQFAVVFERAEKSGRTGDGSAAATTGDGSAAATTGYRSAAATTGDYSAASVEGKHSIAAALGAEAQARGADGCWLVLAEWDGAELLAVHTAQVGHKKHGIRIRPGVFYTVRDGRVVAA